MGTSSLFIFTDTNLRFGNKYMKLSDISQANKRLRLSIDHVNTDRGVVTTFWQWWYILVLLGLALILFCILYFILKYFGCLSTNNQGRHYSATEVEGDTRAGTQRREIKRSASQHISQTRKKTGSIVSEPEELDVNNSNNVTVEEEEKKYLLDLNLSFSQSM